MAEGGCDDHAIFDPDYGDSHDSFSDLVRCDDEECITCKEA